MAQIHILDHPLILHKLGLMRDRQTGTKEFREASREIAMLMLYEATRDLPMKEVEIETPLAHAKISVISGKKLAFVPILRAGLGMVEGMLELIPNAKVGHLGIYRDPETMQPVEYYCKLPGDIASREVILVEPCLATGRSAVAAVQNLKDRGVQDIKLMCLITTAPGLDTIQAAHPDVEIFTTAIDAGLNEQGYIVPGLGDVGDRAYGTK
jgi:uracil phosphoribosyltransferase